MNDKPAGQSLISRLENTSVRTLQIVLIFGLAFATMVLCFLFVRGVILYTPHLTSVDVLRELVTRLFGGVLIVVLGLELLETFKVYFHEQAIRVEAVIVVAIIAVGRHVIFVQGRGV